MLFIDLDDSLLKGIVRLGQNPDQSYITKKHDFSVSKLMKVRNSVTARVDKFSFLLFTVYDSLQTG